MAKAKFGDLYADFVVKHPQKAARTLADLRKRRDRVAAGGNAPSRFDTVESIDKQIANYLRGFEMAQRCEDCGEALDNPTSVQRKVGPTCWARRQARGQATLPTTAVELDADEAF